jgi:hypothetical protein
LKRCIIYKKGEIIKAHIKNKIPKKKYKEYHLTRAISLKEFSKIQSKKISCSPSTYKRLSQKVKQEIENKKINITIDKNLGKPLQNNPKIILETIKLYRQGKSYREIEKTLGITKSSAHYLVKKSKKTKIKKDSLIITI